ncbi:hypothetical protein [Streptomyces tremellae]|uniref:Aromatic ring-opening dioxygenase LigA n=1 Tax=Streptomyces tremellae TaxID=1124239 RepID=A0ABP7EVK5_9ACTN
MAGRQLLRNRALSGACALLCALGTPGQPAAASGAAAYSFDPGARHVTGAATTADAPALAAGGTYRDRLAPGATRVYRVDLDASSSAYVSAVAVPKAGTKVAYGDGIEVALEDRNGRQCSENDSEFGASTDFPRPLAAYAYRTAGGTTTACAQAGPYFAVVRRSGDAGSSHDTWDLELRSLVEPALAKPGPTDAPQDWPSASPTPRSGATAAALGGTGFHDAARLAPGGAWTASIRPGETLFYRVPVDWGQQLFGSVDLASSAAPTPGGFGLVNGAMAVSLFNPALGFVESADAPLYDGRQKTVSLDPLPPVAYQNRFSYRSGERDMRFAGWYYLRISLNPKVGTVYGEGPYGITLRLDVTGKPASAPAYAGSAGPFTVAGDHAAAGAAGPASGGRFDPRTMRLVGYAGIGTGTALVLALLAWTAAARRRHADSG